MFFSVHDSSFKLWIYAYYFGHSCFASAFLKSVYKKLHTYLFYHIEYHRILSFYPFPYVVKQKQLVWIVRVLLYLF